MSDTDYEGRRVSRLRAKVAKVHRRLIQMLGKPAWDGPRDPLESLLLTILSQNTTDVNSSRAWKRLRERFGRLESLLAADVDEIASAIRCGGLANQKSKRIKSFLQWVQAAYGKLSLDVLCEMSPAEALRTLSAHKGIGIKTVYVTLMFACGQDVFPVDTHIERIVKRLDLIPANASAEKTTHLMQPLVPRGESLALHVNLIQFGREVCKAQRPQCWRCPLVRLCRYEAKNLEPPR